MLLNFYGMRWLLILLVIITGTSLPIAHYPLVAVAESNKTTGQKAEADRLFQQGVSQYDNSQFQQALQSWQQALKIYFIRE
jgi:Flp pilus assembly protein TadD